MSAGSSLFKFGVGTATVLGAAAGIGYVVSPDVRSYMVVGAEEDAVTQAPKAGTAEPTARMKVKVTNPGGGRYERTTEQPGRVLAFETADLYAQVSGNLKTQSVDIGDEVKAGQVLAEIDAPERLRDVEHAKAMLKQAQAQAELMAAKITTAEADLEAAKIDVGSSEATLQRSQSMLDLREKQYKRFKALFDAKSLEERLVEEKLDEREAAASEVHASTVAVATSKAKVSSSAAKLAEAKAELEDARAQISVAQAQVAKVQVFEDYTRIVSPLDGVVTQRNFDRGDFIRDAANGGQTPMLTVARSDLMRVVVQIPNSDVPDTQIGNAATIEIQTIPGKVFEGRIARTSRSESRRDLTMRAEIDLPNDEKLLIDGMYATVTIQLGASKDSLTIPASSLVAGSDGGHAVYVVRENKAKLISVHVGGNDGIRAEIRSGLKPDDLIVLRPGRGLSDGVAVEAIQEADAKSADSP